MTFLNDTDKVGAGIILLFALVYLVVSFDIPIVRVVNGEVFTARTLPLLLSTTTIGLCLIQIFMPRKGPVNTTAAVISGFRWKPCLLLTGLMFVYALTFNFFGFLLATLMFLFGGFTVMGERRFLLSSVVSGCVASFMWFFLTQVFDIHLNAGDLYHLLTGS